LLFNDEEGTENGGLIFGGMKDKQGVTHSWGHLSFDEYQRDPTLFAESNSDGSNANGKVVRSISANSTWLRC